MAGAYQTWSGVISGVSLMGMTAVPGKHPAHGKTVCGKGLNTIRNTSGQCPARSVVSMVSGPGRVHERMMDGNSACIGKTLWSINRGDLVCIVSATCLYRGVP